MNIYRCEGENRAPEEFLSDNQPPLESREVETLNGLANEILTKFFFHVIDGPTSLCRDLLPVKMVCKAWNELSKYAQADWMNQTRTPIRQFSIYSSDGLINLISGCDKHLKYINLTGISIDLNGELVEKISELSLLLVRVNTLFSDSSVLFNKDTMRSWRLLSALKSLSLNHSGVGDDICIEIATGLSSLTELCLAGTGVGNSGVIEVAKLTNLLALELRQTLVDDRGVGALISLTNLQRLDLTCTKVGNPGVIAVAKLTSLLSLGLCQTLVDDCGVGALTPSLTNLRALDLTCTKVGNPGVIAVARGLTSLTKFNLSRTNVGDLGIKNIAINLTNLKGLGLRFARISTQAVIALTSLTKLEVLDLGHTNITDQDISVLVPNLPKLQTFGLGSTKIGIRGVLVLARQTNLRRLNLSYTNMRTQDIVPLARHPNLEIVDVSHCDFLRRIPPSVNATFVIK